MAGLKWKDIKDRIGKILEWVVILSPCVLGGYVAYRWLGWTVEDSFHVVVLTFPVVAFLVMRFQLKKETKVIAEVQDPDFGELTKYRNSWLSVLNLKGEDEPLFLQGEGTQEPTVMQRSSVIEIVDTFPRWIGGLEAALDAMKGAPKRPWELFILQIELASDEPEWEMSIVVEKGEADYDFTAKFQEGRLVDLKKD